MWSYYEYRWKVTPHNKVKWPFLDKPLWRGERGKRVALWREHDCKWFFLAQTAMLLGQGASAAAKDYQGYVSNLLEQTLAWSLLALWLHMPAGLRGESRQALQFVGLS